MTYPLLPWPLSCPRCGSERQQEFKWATDKDILFRQICHATVTTTVNGRTQTHPCGFDGNWEPWPPEHRLPNVGFSYDKLLNANRRRNESVARAIAELEFARRLTIHVPNLHERLGAAIEELGEIMQWSGTRT